MKPVRLLTVDDYVIVRQILTQCGLMTPTFAEAFSPAAFSRLVEKNTGACLAVEMDIIRSSTVVGVVLASHDWLYGHIYKLAVLPEYRRQHGGLDLLLSAVDMLQRQGVRQIFAHVAKANTASIALLQKAGFHIRDTHFLVDNLECVAASR